MYDADAANHATGGYDVPDAHPKPDAPQAPPNVYHPLPEGSPSYEEYVDPAAAHGWQNAYDETAQLPAVVDAGHGVPDETAPARADGAGAAEGYDYSYSGPDDDYGFSEERGRRVGGTGRGSRRKPTAPRARRVVIAAGAVGVVSAAALIAAFSLSGSSSGGGTQTKDDRTSPTALDPAAPTELPGGASAGARPSDGTESSRSASPSASTSPSASDVADSDDKSPSPDPTTTSAAPPSSTPTATTNAPGNSDEKPGQGQGSTKKPG
ncbi:hypothetical protein ADL12_39315 [Streptomyces regalis]|uniref:Uncharacterized protein n=2 Tax=Streptomyces regalis TaxID=68262 RepID=A0A117ML82_9ACTN|nr:hypothetical protein ADL12_39315 [Streptomyces regalis]